MTNGGNAPDPPGSESSSMPADNTEPGPDLPGAPQYPPYPHGAYPTPAPEQQPPGYFPPTYPRFQTPQQKSSTCLILAVVGVALLTVIAIMAAIAIPTFFGARMRAQDRLALASLKNAQAAEDTAYLATGMYAPADELDRLAPNGDISFVTSPPAPGGREVRVGLTGDYDGVCLMVKSASGSYFALGDIAAGPGAGTYYFGPTETDPIPNCTDDAIQRGSSTPPSLGAPRT